MDSVKLWSGTKAILTFGRVFANKKQVFPIHSHTVLDVWGNESVEGIYATGLSGLVYAYSTSPSEASMFDELRELRQIMIVLPAPVHSKESDVEFAERSILLSQDQLHYHNLWFFSLLVRFDYDKAVRIYGSQDKNPKDWIWS
ncbi:hypothetical protein KIN20_022165 [Parelaphostrongylus tenuis]|uniref:Uncharacterized protein n=1 Tax=Parelaphostrongylus tenuis TaxID=148309 RepID=A0AAD5NBF8_PARTN|nr:hypothetical protein KIN20_022165 [Parelaphostrongylus tenuis]